MSETNLKNLFHFSFILDVSTLLAAHVLWLVFQCADCTQ